MGPCILSSLTLNTFWDDCWPPQAWSLPGRHFSLWVTVLSKVASDDCWREATCFPNCGSGTSSQTQGLRGPRFYKNKMQAATWCCLHATGWEALDQRWEEKEGGGRRAGEGGLLDGHQGTGPTLLFLNMPGLSGLRNEW